MEYEDRICGTCEFSQRDERGTFICMNVESEAYGFETDYTECCTEWQEQ